VGGGGADITPWLGVTDVPVLGVGRWYGRAKTLNKPANEAAHCRVPYSADIE
jgi:hypothetical protein